MGTEIKIITDVVTVTITGDRPDIGPTYDKFEGWYGTPDVDLGLIKRPGAPGAFAPEQTFPDEAVISIEGQHFAPTRAAGLEMREMLSALYNDGRPVTVVVTDDLRTTRRQCLVAKVDLPWTIHPDFTYSIDMSAADPRRYGATIAQATTLATAGEGLTFPLVFPLDFGEAGVSGRITITNAGITATTSLFEVGNGTMLDGFAIVNVTTGQRLTYLGPVQAGTTVELDANTQTAFINGITPAGRWLASPEWWVVPALSSIEVQFIALGPTTGDPKLSVSTAHAYY